MGNRRDDIDILALARLAQAKGYSDPPRLAQHLQAIIERNTDYLARPYRQSHPTAYDAALKEDNEVLAMIILERIEQSSELL